MKVIVIFLIQETPLWRHVQKLYHYAEPYKKKKNLTDTDTVITIVDEGPSDFHDLQSKSQNFNYPLWRKDCSQIERTSSKPFEDVVNVVLPEDIITIDLDDESETADDPSIQEYNDAVVETPELDADFHNYSFECESVPNESEEEHSVIELSEDEIDESVSEKETVKKILQQVKNLKVSQKTKKIIEEPLRKVLHKSVRVELSSESESEMEASKSHSTENNEEITKNSTTDLEKQTEESEKQIDQSKFPGIKETVGKILLNMQNQVGSTTLQNSSGNKMLSDQILASVADQLGEKLLQFLQLNMPSIEKVLEKATESTEVEKEQEPVTNEISKLPEYLEPSATIEMENTKQVTIEVSKPENITSETLKQVSESVTSKSLKVSEPVTLEVSKPLTSEVLNPISEPATSEVVKQVKELITTKVSEQVSESVMSEVLKPMHSTYEISKQASVCLVSEVSKSIPLVSEVSKSVEPLVSEVLKPVPRTSEVSKSVPLVSEVLKPVSLTSEVLKSVSLTSEISKSKSLMPEFLKQVIPSSEVLNPVPKVSDISKVLQPVMTEVTKEISEVSEVPLEVKIGKTLEPLVSEVTIKVSNPEILKSVSDLITDVDKITEPTTDEMKRISKPLTLEVNKPLSEEKTEAFMTGLQKKSIKSKSIKEVNEPKSGISELPAQVELLNTVAAPLIIAPEIQKAIEQREAEMKAIIAQISKPIRSRLDKKSTKESKLDRELEIKELLERLSRPIMEKKSLDMKISKTVSLNSKETLTVSEPDDLTKCEILNVKGAVTDWNDEEETNKTTIGDRESESINDAECKAFNRLQSNASNFDDMEEEMMNMWSGKFSRQSSDKIKNSERKNQDAIVTEMVKSVHEHIQSVDKTINFIQDLSEEKPQKKMEVPKDVPVRKYGVKSSKMIINEPSEVSKKEVIDIEDNNKNKNKKSRKQSLKKPDVKNEELTSIKEEKKKRGRRPRQKSEEQKFDEVPKNALKSLLKTQHNEIKKSVRFSEELTKTHTISDPEMDDLETESKMSKKEECLIRVYKSKAMFDHHEDEIENLFNKRKMGKILNIDEELEKLRKNTENHDRNRRRNSFEEEQKANEITNKVNEMDDEEKCSNKKQMTQEEFEEKSEIRKRGRKRKEKKTKVVEKLIVENNAEANIHSGMQKRRQKEKESIILTIKRPKRKIEEKSRLSEKSKVTVDELHEEIHLKLKQKSEYDKNKNDNLIEIHKPKQKNKHEEIFTKIKETNDVEYKDKQEIDSELTPKRKHNEAHHKKKHEDSDHHKKKHRSHKHKHKDEDKYQISNGKDLSLRISKEDPKTVEERRKKLDEDFDKLREEYDLTIKGQVHKPELNMQEISIFPTGSTTSRIAQDETAIDKPEIKKSNLIQKDLLVKLIKEDSLINANDTREKHIVQFPKVEPIRDLKKQNEELQNTQEFSCTSTPLVPNTVCSQILHENLKLQVNLICDTVGKTNNPQISQENLNPQVNLICGTVQKTTSPQISHENISPRVNLTDDNARKTNSPQMLQKNLNQQVSLIRETVCKTNSPQILHENFNPQVTLIQNTAHKAKSPQVSHENLSPEVSLAHENYLICQTFNPQSNNTTHDIIQQENIHHEQNTYITHEQKQGRRNSINVIREVPQSNNALELLIPRAQEFSTVRNVVQINEFDEEDLEMNNIEIINNESNLRRDDVCATPIHIIDDNSVLDENLADELDLSDVYNDSYGDQEKISDENEFMEDVMEQTMNGVREYVFEHFPNEIKSSHSVDSILSKKDFLNSTNPVVSNDSDLPNGHELPDELTNVPLNAICQQEKESLEHLNPGAVTIVEEGFCTYLGDKYDEVTSCLSTYVSERNIKDSNLMIDDDDFDAENTPNNGGRPFKKYGKGYTKSKPKLNLTYQQRYLVERFNFKPDDLQLLETEVIVTKTNNIPLEFYEKVENKNQSVIDPTLLSFMKEKTSTTILERQDYTKEKTSDTQTLRARIERRPAKFKFESTLSPSPSPIPTKKKKGNISPTDNLDLSNLLISVPPKDHKSLCPSRIPIEKPLEIETFDQSKDRLNQMNKVYDLKDQMYISSGICTSDPMLHPPVMSPVPLESPSTQIPYWDITANVPMPSECVTYKSEIADVDIENLIRTQCLDSPCTSPEHETHLPIKKRRVSSLKVVKDEVLKDKEVSYPSTSVEKMMSIAEIVPPSIKFKTPAELKEIPPLTQFPQNVTPFNPAPYQYESPLSINHTYNNPTINYHIGSTPLVNFNYATDNNTHLPSFNSLLMSSNGNKNYSNWPQPQFYHDIPTFVPKEQKKKGRPRKETVRRNTRRNKN